MGAAVVHPRSEAGARRETGGAERAQTSEGTTRS